MGTGGSVGLLALNALFVLMTEYNLCVISCCIVCLAADFQINAAITPRFIPACMHSWTAMFCISNTVRDSSG